MHTTRTGATQAAKFTVSHTLARQASCSGTQARHTGQRDCVKHALASVVASYKKPLGHAALLLQAPSIQCGQFKRRKRLHAALFTLAENKWPPPSTLEFEHATMQPSVEPVLVSKQTADAARDCTQRGMASSSVYMRASEL